MVSGDVTYHMLAPVPLLLLRVRAQEIPGVACSLSVSFESESLRQNLPFPVAEEIAGVHFIEVIPMQYNI
jgi:hypothetical protein